MVDEIMDQYRIIEEINERRLTKRSIDLRYAQLGEFIYTSLKEMTREEFKNNLKHLINLAQRYKNGFFRSTLDRKRKYN